MTLPRVRLTPPGREIAIAARGIRNIHFNLLMWEISHACITKMLSTDDEIERFRSQS